MNITLVSTVHEEMGKCTADALLEILEQIGPEVIFLEALDDTYTSYQHENFRSSEVFHEKLEIRAIQKYWYSNPVNYIPVLTKSLPGSFDRLIELVDYNIGLSRMKDDLFTLTKAEGFTFLNSDDCVNLHEQMSSLARGLLQARGINTQFDDDIDAYENEMIRNIYSFCEDNQFNTAVFVCGSAHRKSIMEKIEAETLLGRTNVKWTIYSGCP